MTNGKLILKTPELRELTYRKHLLSDPKTMSFNSGYEVDDDYNQATGCINFDEKNWESWYNRWVKNKERFYAYVCLNDGTPIGEASFRYNKAMNAYNCSLIIESKYRGNHYSEEALNLLCDVAKNEYHVERLIDDIPSSRIHAIQIFKKCGFTTFKHYRHLKFNAYEDVMIVEKYLNGKVRIKDEVDDLPDGDEEL